MSQCRKRYLAAGQRASRNSEISGEDIIFSDGTSVLGADNKAAVSVVMTMLENLTSEHQHGDIVVAFVPDEETGLRGAKSLDLQRFSVDFAGQLTVASQERLFMKTLTLHLQRSVLLV